MKRPSGPDSTASEPAHDPKDASANESRRSNSTAGFDDDPPSSGRRLRIAPDSPFADAAAVFAASDLAQLSALDVSAELFFNEVVEHLHLHNPCPGEPYAHATIAETVRRFQRAAKRPRARRAENSKGKKSRLPNFPRFRLDQTFYNWVHELSQAEDIAEFTTVLGTTTARAYIQITSGMLLVHGLPKFFARCVAGDFTIEHANATAYACRDVKFENLPLIDEYLAERRPDITIETFKKSLGMKIAVLEPLEERVEEASKRRRVDISTAPDGTAYLTLTGPAPELQACYIRIAAFAKAIRSGNIAPFGDQVEPGMSIDDDRGIAALMFDILTRTCPQLNIQVTSNNTTTGQTSTREIPLDLPDGASLTPADVVNAVNAGLASGVSGSDDADRGHTDGGHTDRGHSDEDGPASDVETQAEVVLRMPTHGQWLDSQAKMVTTVPFLTLAGECELPGVFSDDSPIPADTARRIAGHSKTWTRMLTDPATGTPVDAKAKTYQIPSNVRQTLVAKWRTCTIPGCLGRAENTEIDHIIPFDRDHPERGGLTRFGNLHCVCKLHHQAKTDRKYSVRMSRTGVLEYVFRHGITTEVAPGDHPINAAHAKLFDEMRPKDAKSLDPPEPRARSEDQPMHGDIRKARKRPGPKATGEQPGWVKNSSMLRPLAKKNEWIWDSGGPPPF